MGSCLTWVCGDSNRKNYRAKKEKGMRASPFAGTGLVFAGTDLAGSN